MDTPAKSKQPQLLTPGFTCWALLAALLYCCVGTVWAQTQHGTAEQPIPGYVYGRVVKITDGDTLTLLTKKEEQIRVRLAEIDTPERGQPFGRKSQDALSALVWDQDIAVRVVDIDRYGRTVGRIYVDGVDVSAEMVIRGAAWVYRKYATDHQLFVLEEEARAARRGLWALSEVERVPPWEWRRRK